VPFRFNGVDLVVTGTSPATALETGTEAAKYYAENGSKGPLIIAVIDTPVQQSGTAADTYMLKPLSIIQGDVVPPADSPTHGTAMFQTVALGTSSQNTAKAPSGESR
jgi:hypothetical protein